MTMQSAYPYVVFMLRGTNGTPYTPYVATRGGTGNSQASGFSTAPTVVNMGNYDQLSFTAMYDGSIQLYYTTSSTTPTQAQFTTAFQSYMTSPAGVPYTQGSVKAGQKYDIQFNPGQYSTTPSIYTHVVIMLTSGTTTYQPVVVTRSSISSSLGGTGFTNYPTVSATDTYDTLYLGIGSMGYVEYYYVNSYYASVISSMAATNSNAFGYYSSYGQYGSQTNYLQPSTYGYQTVSTSVNSAAATTAGLTHVVMRFVSYGTAGMGMSYSTPVVVQRQNTGSTGSGSGSGSTSTSGNGFSSRPTVATDDGGNRRVTFTSSVSGKLMYYYYTSTSDVPSSKLDFITKYNTIDSDKKGSIDVTSGISIREPLKSSGLTKIAFMLVTDDGDTMYDPYTYTIGN